MVKIGFIFPGQGAQYVGMGKELYDEYHYIRELYDLASSVTGIDVASISFNGPQEVLTKTLNAQVCIYAVSMAVLEVIKREYPELKPSVVLGLSLGEYSALTAAGSIGVRESFLLVKKRGELMEAEAEKSCGGMVSIIGLDDDLCRDVADEAGIDVANYNSYGQVVLSGEKDKVEKAALLAKEKGAKRAVLLDVDGAFHSRLMKRAGDSLREVLAGVELRKPSVKFIQNVTADYAENADEIKENLAKQVASSVRWTESFSRASVDGVKKYIEIGPGNVLKGLARRIDRGTKVISVVDCGGINSIGGFLT